MTRFTTRGARFLRVALDVFAALTLLAWLANPLLGAWTWPLGFVLHFFDASWIAWLAGLLIGVVVQSRPRMVLHGTCALLWLAHFGPRVVRGFVEEPVRVEGELRVITLNTGNGRATPLELCKALSGYDADVVFLQELAVEHANAIERANDLPFEYRALFPGGIPGKGMLARYPMRDVRFERHDDGATTLRGVLIAPRGDIELVDLHSRAPAAFFGPWVDFDEQIETLARELPRERPVIIAGDFNVASDCALLDPLRQAGFRESFDQNGAGLGLSFPMFLRYRGLPLPPIVRIDHVWSRELQSFDARVIEDAGSDHLPLRVRFR